MINWFEIPTTDLARARHVYQQVLETELLSLMILDTERSIFPYSKPGTGGALIKSAMFIPLCQGSLVYRYTANLAAVLQRVVFNSGQVILAPEILANNIGTIALLIDCEDNRVGFHQPA